MSWSPKFFKDLGKDISDLFADKTYPLDNSVVVKTHVEEANFEAKTSIQNESNASTTLKVKETLPKDYGVLEINTASQGELSAKLTNKGSLVGGLETTVQGGQKAVGSGTKEMSTFYSVGFKYNTSAVGATVDFDVAGSNTTASSSALFGYNNVAVGIDVAAKLGGADNQVSDFNAGLQWTSGSSVLAAKTAKKASQAQVLIGHEVSSKTTVAFGLDAPVTALTNPTISVGGTTKLDSATLKGFVNSTGAVSFLYSRDLSSAASLQLAASTKLPVLLAGKPNTVSWGLKLTLGDL